MSLFALFSLLIVFAALCSYINFRFFSLPATVGVMLSALGASLVVLCVNFFTPVPHQWAAEMVSQIDFDQALLHGALSLLLFAGSLHVDLGELIRDKIAVTTLAILGTFISTFLVGAGTYYIFMFLGYNIPFIYCLIFGAIISPTDPVAVLAIMHKVKAPKSIELRLAGESLFNDGIGVVLFITLVGMATGHHETDAASIGMLLLKEVGGAVFLGLGLGYITYLLMKSIEDYQVEILLSLALAMGGYALADSLHFSAPIFAVVAGLLIGNPGRSLAMTEQTREHLDTFWELLDGILNTTLFVLLGLELLALPLDWKAFLVGLAAVPIILLSRYVSVVSIYGALRKQLKPLKGEVAILTWGALRGGISVAMALSLHTDTHRNTLIACTYVVVIFSIAVQGLTIGPLIRKFTGKTPAPASDNESKEEHH